jgi:phosphatidylglycerol:prolipoprotein diacylglycerol transferase
MYPVIFVIPWIGVPVFSYGFMLGLSFVLGWVIIMRLGSADGLDKEILARCFMVTAASAIVAARLLYVLVNIETFRMGGWWKVLALNDGGLVAYGGFLGGFLGAWLYLSCHGIKLLAFTDVAVFSLASGLGITRLGCFLFGCCWGKPVPESAPALVKALAVRFPNWEVHFNAFREISHGLGTVSLNLQGSPAFLYHRSQGWVAPEAAYSLPVYPTQLLESLNGCIAFALLFLARKKRRFVGQVFCLFTMYYGLTRTAMEFLRGDKARGEAWGLFTSQWIGLATFILAFIAYQVLSRRSVAPLSQGRRAG